MPKLVSAVHKLHREDSGAISSLFLVLLASGLLLAVVGLVVDTGTVMVQRQLVRNAADAVADVVAMHCSKTPAGTNCLTDTYSTTGMDSASITNAEYLAAIANPKGGHTTIDGVCGVSVASLGLTPCAALTDANYECQTDLANSAYANWVRVYTSSGDAGFQAPFASLYTGSQTHFQERACAQVAWGKHEAIQVDKSGGQLPLLFGTCALKTTDFGKVTYLKETKAATACASLAAWHSGTRSGSTNGFAVFEPVTASTACYTAGVGGTCSPTYVSEVAVKTTAGAGVTTNYSTLVSTLTGSLGKTFVLPVMGGSDGSYTLQGFAAFKLLGFNLPTGKSGTKTVNATAARQYLTPVTAASLNTYCGAAPSSTTVPCVVGVFSPRTVSGYNQLPNAAPSGSRLPNLGYQIEVHIP